MVNIWKEKKSWIRFSPKTMKFRMVAQVPQNIIANESFQKVSNDLAWVNEVCWRSFLEDTTTGVVSLQDTLWEVRNITGREVVQNRVKYEVQWREKNGRRYIE